MSTLRVRPAALLAAAAALVLAGCGGSARAPAGRPFALVAGRSSCQESATTATIRCSIGVRNLGGSPGRPTVWAYYFFSDSGSAFDYSGNGECRPSPPIAPGVLGFVSFCHAYDPTQHDLTRVAASLDENSTQYIYVRVARPGGRGWPAA